MACGRTLGCTKGDGNCAPRSIAQQIKANDLLMLQDPSLTQYAVPASVARDHKGLRSQFVGWLRANSDYLSIRAANPLLLKSDSTLCDTALEYAYLAAKDGFWLGTLFLHWCARHVMGDSEDECNAPPLYNYVLLRKPVTFDAAVTVGVMYRVSPFPQA